MSDRPISFRVCDFSEQITDASYAGTHKAYSAVMHIDGCVYQYKKALNDRFQVPLSALRSEAWLSLLQKFLESNNGPR